MNNEIKKRTTWHFANEKEITETFNPEITTFANWRNQIYIEIKSGDGEYSNQFTVLDLPTAKDFAKHILNEIKVIEKLIENGEVDYEG